MSVDRTIEIRLLTNLNYFSQVLELLIDNEFSFNDDGTITSLSETDIDDFDYIKYSSFAVVKDILDNREDNGLDNHVVIWDKSIDDSLRVWSKRIDSIYEGYKQQYSVVLSIGIGVRIKGAERYTDFGIYLNKLLPLLLKNSIYICEVNCNDFDC